MGGVFSLTHVLDFAILLFILNQIVSLADLIILPEQKKRIDQWCEDVTLRLNYVRAIEWYQRWLRATRRAHIAELLFILSGLVVYVVAIGGLALEVRNNFDWESMGLLVLASVGILAGWSFVSKIFFAISRPVLNILSKASSFIEFIITYALFMAVGLFVVFIGIWFLYITGYSDALAGNRASTTVHIVGLFVFALVATWVLIFADGIVTLVGVCFVWLAHVGVVTARAIMWRVARYPKGPFAALTLIAVVFLGIARVAVSS
jgi:hypothetical protein